jgi:hypothetical protein
LGTVPEELQTYGFDPNPAVRAAKLCETLEIVDPVHGRDVRLRRRAFQLQRDRRLVPAQAFRCTAATRSRCRSSNGSPTVELPRWLRAHRREGTHSTQHPIGLALTPRPVTTHRTAHRRFGAWAA